MNRSKNILVMLLVMLLLVPTTVYAWTAYEKNIKVRFAQIKLFANEKEIVTSTEPFIYEGNVYAPVATIANVLGVKWSWDNQTPAVRFKDEAYRLIEENYESGSLQVYGLGEDVYLYMESGIPSIQKGLKYQDPNNEIIEVPVLKKEGLTSSQFWIPLKQLIDIDGDGQKHELLISYPLHQDEDLSELHTYVAKLIPGEARFELLSYVMKEPTPALHEFMYDEVNQKLYAQQWTNGSAQLASIKIYEWQQDGIRQVQELAPLENEH